MGIRSDSRIMTIMKTRSARSLACSAFFVGSFLSFFHLSSPYIYIGLMGALACLVMALGSKKRRLWWVYFAWSFVLLVGIEFVYWKKAEGNPVAQYEGGFSLDDLEVGPNFGFVRVKEEKRRVRKWIDGKLLYDVEYEIDSDGLRKTPSFGDNASILFFGGSLIFGEGVSIENTVPYQVGKRLEASTYIFAYPGYGPHQSLRAVECGIVEEAVRTEPNLIVLYTFPDHIRRILGKAPWDPFGPKYVQQPSGEIVFEGPFNSRFSGELQVYANEFLRRSIAWQTGFQSNPAITASDIEFYARLVSKMASELRLLYPKAEFHVIVFDPLEPGNNLARKMIEALTYIGIEAHSTRSIFSRYEEDRDRYRLHRFDDHHTAYANSELADYIVGLATGIAADVTTPSLNSSVSAE